MMLYHGHVENGLIRLDGAVPLPEGAEVEVRLLPGNGREEGPQGVPSVCETLRDFVGKIDGLPPDASINHDHYLYGIPKR